MDAGEDDNKLQQRNGKSSPKKSISRAASWTPASPLPGRAKRPQASQFETEVVAATVAEAVQASPGKKAKRDETESGVLISIMLPNAESFTCNLYPSTMNSTATMHNQIYSQYMDWMKNPENHEKKSGNLRSVKWGPQVWLEDYCGERFSYRSFLATVLKAKQSEPVCLVLCDGEPDPLYENKKMYNITPKAEMLRQLPQGYTIQTALADHVDNALQAVWNNEPEDVRLVSVTLGPDKITIFDTGRGMDCTDDKHIAKWGTVGSSTHRAMHHEAVGLEPPFLRPYLGKYGAGGVAAALHLGSLVTVSSKTKESKKVWSLTLDKNALLERQAEDRSWMASGSCRDMSSEEANMSPHLSFTKVEITQLKSQYGASDGKEGFFTVDQIRELLKDIYYPYIQTETGTSSKTIFPVKFLVNKRDLREITQCRTAIANWASCNGEWFVIDVQMTKELDEWDPATGTTLREEVANARITCRYYPYQKGQEALESVIDELKKLKPTADMNFDSFRRVSMRWLGRLLPDVPWRTFPFMEVAPTRNRQRLDMEQQWARRVCAFVDMDGGFHPILSKVIKYDPYLSPVKSVTSFETQLEKDQPFVVALQNMGKDDLSGTSGQGVSVSIKHKGRVLSTVQLKTDFRDWLQQMHYSYDEEFRFRDEPTYIFDHLNVEEELGVRSKIVLLHKRMIYGKEEFQLGGHGHPPLWIKLPKAKGSKSQTDIYATVEYFYHDGNEDEPGDIKFIYRLMGEENGCRVIQKDGMCHFELNNSKWLHATKLSTAVRLDETAWKRKIEEISNKSPSYIDVLQEEDLKKLELGEALPTDKSQCEAGHCLPKELYVVVRPKKGSGPTFKQGMIAMDTVKLGMTVMYCSCSTALCSKRKTGGSGSSGRASSSVSHSDEHMHQGKIVAKLSAFPAAVKGGIRGIYMFSLGSSSVKQLINKGTYVFHIFAEEEQYAEIAPASSTILVHSSEVTAKWTLCNHKDVCKFAEHDTSRFAVKIRLNEPVQEEVFLQKYDTYGNCQGFDDSLDLEATVRTSTGEALGMECSVRADIPEISKSNGRLRLQLKNLLFRNGSLEGVEPTYKGVLCVRCPADYTARINCKVLPGEVASVQVKDSWPSIPLRLCGSVLSGEDDLQLVSRSLQGKVNGLLSLSPPELCFQEALQPGEVVKRLTLQGFDDFGNKIDKGQRIRLELAGLELQDENTGAREVDEQGCMHLGGLLKVSCHYNSKGSLKIISSKGLELCIIHFKTVERQLLIASKVPDKAYVGTELKGVRVYIVDENDDVDTGVHGHSQSLTVDWLEGVTYPLTKGECVLQAFKLPEKPGPWKGNVYFSANKLLHATLTVNLELAPAHSLAPATRTSAVLNAQCGIPFWIPFLVLDERQQRTVLPDGMKHQITAKVEALDSADDGVPLLLYRPCTVEVQAIQMASGQGVPSYEACVVISGSVGRFKFTLLDGSSQLAGQIDSDCNLQHGAIARLSFLKPLAVLEAPRGKPMPAVTVYLVDSEENLCTSCDNRLLQMKIPSHSAWLLETKVTEGKGNFTSPPLLLPVQNHSVAITLVDSPDNCYSLDEPLEPPKAKFTLKVVHGNYPAALRLLRSDPIHMSLERTSSESEYVPPISVLVESADGKDFQDRPSVGVRFQVPSGTGQDIREYFGRFVEDNASTFSGSKYEFTQICAPCQAGTYQMEFFVCDSEVKVQVQLLHVKHGPPARVEIIQSAPKEQMDPFLVKLVDLHGNICDDYADVEVELSVLTPNLPRSVLRKNKAEIIHGKGDFGRFTLSDGEEGKYSLEVSVCGENVPGPITRAECTIFVSQGNVDEEISRLLSRKQDMIKRRKAHENSISELRRRLNELSNLEQSMETEFSRAEGEKKELERQGEYLESLQKKNHDEETFQESLKQPFRSPENVIRDVRMRGPTAAHARALLEAQSGNNFLSPRSSDPAARDVLGLVVLLACVESKSLNTELSKYLGVSDLTMIVCRTQQGVDALIQRDQHGNIVKSRGLHGFAQLCGSFEISEESDIKFVDLSDLSYFRRKDSQSPVDSRHPQCLLKMDPPTLRNGHVPAGFLGFAVNLVHLSPDQLQLRGNLFFHLFKYLEVYDTWQNVMAAKKAIRKWSDSAISAISLDGIISIKDGCQQIGRPKSSDPHSSLCFGSIQHDEIISGSLLPPRRAAFERANQAEIILKKIKLCNRRKELSKSNVSQAQKEITELQATVGEIKEEYKKLTAEDEHLEVELENVMEAKKAMEARRKMDVLATGSAMESEGLRIILI